VKKKKASWKNTSKMPTIITEQATIITKGNEKKINPTRQQQQQAIYGTRRWRRLRIETLMQHPICQICNKKLAEEVHHIIPFMQYEGQQRITVAYNSKNLLAVCTECHTKKHSPNEKDSK
jgi:5-methylcytosine-specific restriction endonuclease McrA